MTDSRVGFDHWHRRCHEHPELGYICGKVLYEHLEDQHGLRSAVRFSDIRVGPHE